MRGNQVALQGFPRSGKDLLRSYIEVLTGVTTGSDSSIEHSFNLAMMGMQGQEFVNDSNKVWVTGTHFPVQSADAKKFNAQKMICIVRNPLDVIASNAKFYATQGHNL